MASFRPDKLGSLIRNIVGDVIAHKLQDPRVSPLTSVTRVEVSGDLQHAKIFVSVMGGESEQKRTMLGLDHARGHIQRIIAKQITARTCPHIRFVVDDSIKYSAQISKIIDDSLEQSPQGATDDDSPFDNGESEDVDDLSVETKTDAAVGENGKLSNNHRGPND